MGESPWGHGQREVPEGAGKKGENGFDFSTVEKHHKPFGK
jgi:hypothetical protein